MQVKKPDIASAPWKAPSWLLFITYCQQLSWAGYFWDVGRSLCALLLLEILSPTLIPAKRGTFARANKARWRRQHSRARLHGCGPGIWPRSIHHLTVLDSLQGLSSPPSILSRREQPGGRKSLSRTLISLNLHREHCLTGWARASLSNF